MTACNKQFFANSRKTQSLSISFVQLCMNDITVKFAFRLYVMDCRMVLIFFTASKMILCRTQCLHQLVMSKDLEIYIYKSTLKYICHRGICVLLNQTVALNMVWQQTFIVQCFYVNALGENC